MGRGETSNTKKEVMKKIAILMKDGIVVDRKQISNSQYTILAWASKDHTTEGGLHNWYGFFEDDFKIANPQKTLLLFTTGDAKNFLLIPFKDFEKEIKPFMRTPSGGYFFLVRREGNDWFLPKDYIPKNIRDDIKGKGIMLNKYLNNLQPIGQSYNDYLKLISGNRPSSVSQDATDITAMIKLIAEKDPSFLAKSTEEKLIIIRYYQIMGE